MSFVGSKEFKGMNWIHYPYDFIAIIVLSLIFIKLVLQVTSIVFTSNVLRKSIKMKDGSPEEAKQLLKVTNNSNV